MLGCKLTTGAVHTVFNVSHCSNLPVQELVSWWLTMLILFIIIICWLETVVTAALTMKLRSGRIIKERKVMVCKDFQYYMMKKYRSRYSWTIWMLFIKCFLRSFYKQYLYEYAMKRENITEMKKTIENLFNFLAQENIMKEGSWGEWGRGDSRLEAGTARDREKLGLVTTDQGEWVTFSKAWYMVWHHHDLRMPWDNFVIQGNIRQTVI